MRVLLTCTEVLHPGFNEYGEAPDDDAIKCAMQRLLRGEARIGFVSNTAADTTTTEQLLEDRLR